MPYRKQTPFQGGEIGPELYGRTDKEAIHAALRRSRNWIPLPNGAITTRPGTMRVMGHSLDSAAYAATSDYVRNLCAHTPSDQKARLVPFIFSRGDSETFNYVLAVGNSRCRFHVAMPDGNFQIGPPDDAVHCYQLHVRRAPGGTWSSLTTYSLGNVVSYLGKCYTSLQGSNTNHTPSSSPTWWAERTDRRYSPLWDSSVTYPKDAYVHSAGNVIFRSLQANNLNHATTDAAWWVADPAYEIELGITAAMLPKLKWCQAGDTIIFFCQGYTPIQLQRYGDWDWRVSSYSTTRSQAAPTNLALVTSTPNSDATHIAKEWDVCVTAVSSDNEGEESLPSSEIQITQAIYSDRPAQYSWTAPSGNIGYYNVYRRRRGGLWGYVGSCTTNGFFDDGLAPITSVGPPEGRNPFPTANDKPSCGEFHQQRLVMANTLANPANVYGSQVGAFHNHDRGIPPRPDDAYLWTIAAKQFEEVRSLVSLKKLIVLTSGAEWIMQGGDGGVITPNSVDLVPHSNYGSGWLDPIRVGEGILYIPHHNNSVREHFFASEGDTWGGNDLSILARHLFEGHQIVDVAYQRSPYGIVWMVRDDGKLLSLTYDRKNQVYAWALHETATGDTFENVACIPESMTYNYAPYLGVQSPTAAEDAVYFIVRRYMNGGWVRVVERLGSFYRPNPWAFADLDSHSYWGTGVFDTHMTGRISGASYVAGATVNLDLSVWPEWENIVERLDQDAILIEYGSAVYRVQIDSYTGIINDPPFIRRYSCTLKDTLPAGLQNTPFAIDGTVGRSASRASAWIASDRIPACLGDAAYSLANQVVAYNGMPIAWWGAPKTGPAAGWASSRVVGLPFTATLETLDLMLPDTEVGPLQKIVQKAWIDVAQAAGLAAGDDSTRLEDQASLGFVAYGGTAFYEGRIEVLLSPTWNTGGRVTVQQAKAYPSTLVAVVREYEIAPQD